MNIEQRSINTIRPYREQPFVVDKDGVIIIGHARWKAAHKLGLEKVPVHVADELTPTQTKAYRIADNKLAELGNRINAHGCRADGSSRVLDGN